MNSFKLSITVNLSGEYNSSISAYQQVDVSGLTLFQVSWILGGLQVLMDEAKAEKEEKR